MIFEANEVPRSRQRRNKARQHEGVWFETVRRLVFSFSFLPILFLEIVDASEKRSVRNLPLNLLKIKPS